MNMAVEVAKRYKNPLTSSLLGAIKSVTDEYEEQNQAIFKYAKDNYFNSHIDAIGTRWEVLDWEEVVLFDTEQDGSGASEYTEKWRLSENCDGVDCIKIFVVADYYDGENHLLDKSLWTRQQVRDDEVSDEQLAEWRGVFVEFLKSKGML